MAWRARCVGELHTTHPPRNPITFFEIMRQEIAMSIFKLDYAKTNARKQPWEKKMQRKDVFPSAISKRHWLGMSFVDLFLRWRVVVLACRCVCVPLRCHCSLVVSLACRFAGCWTVVALACRKRKKKKEKRKKKKEKGKKKKREKKKEKRKKEKRKKKKEKEERKRKRKKQEKKRKRGPKGVPPETAQKLFFLHKSLVWKS